LFIAALLPDDVLDLLASLPRPQEPGVRYTRRDQWHVTLRFLGSCEIDAAREAFDRINASAATGALGPAVSRLGRSVVVVPIAGLEPLAASVAAVTAAVGEPPDPRPFTGHVTVARLKGRPACRIAGHPVRASFAVRELHLVRSDTHADGAVYQTVAATTLRRQSS
jgi:2'-5' RNA ligase